MLLDYTVILKKKQFINLYNNASNTATKYSATIAPRLVAGYYTKWNGYFVDVS